MFSGSPQGGYAPFIVTASRWTKSTRGKCWWGCRLVMASFFPTTLGIEANPTVPMRQWPSMPSPINGGRTDSDVTGDYTKTRKMVILQ